MELYRKRDDSLGDGRIWRHNLQM